MKSRKIFFVYLMIGVLMAGLCGCSGLKFEKYSSKDPELKFTLEHISGWKVVEERGAYNSYAQVMFYPLSNIGMSQAMMLVLLEKAPKSLVGSAALKKAEDDFIAKRMQFKESKVLSRSKISFLGKEATVIEMSYKSLENILKVNSKLIAFKEKVLIFQKNESFYFLIYQNSFEDFERFHSGFTHLVKTLRFKN